MGIIQLNAKYAEYRKNESFSPLAKVSSNGLLIPAVKDGVVLGPLSEGFILDAIYENVVNKLIRTIKFFLIQMHFRYFINLLRPF